jgi:ankyrin repeat protein
MRALHYAAKTDNVVAVHELLNHNAHIEATDSVGNSALLLTSANFPRISQA